MARREQLLDCMKEAATEPFHALRGWRGAVRQNAGSSRRKMRGQGLLRAERSIGGIAGDWSGQCCRGNTLGGVPQKGCAQPGGLFRAERRAKTGLGMA